MALRPQSLPPVPEATAAVMHGPFPRGNLSVELRHDASQLAGPHPLGIDRKALKTLCSRVLAA
jgi:hypothetical protein